MKNNNVQSLEKIIQFITDGLEHYESIKIKSDDCLLCVSKCTIVQQPFFFYDNCTINHIYDSQDVYVPKKVVEEFRVLIDTIGNYLLDHKEIQGIEGEWENIYFLEYKGSIYSYVYGLLGPGMVKTEKTEDMSLYKTGYTEHIIKFDDLNQYYIDKVKIKNEEKDGNNKVKVIELSKQ